jgi:DNA-binding transcriptional ArsR family regulator
MDRAMDSSTASAPDLDAALRALADGNRRRILALVRDQAGAVGEIAEGVAMSQQAVSHHLRVLRGAGLVTEQREGTRHLFRVRTDGLRVVEEFLDGFWPTHLAALKRAAEAESRRRQAGAVQDG